MGSKLIVVDPRTTWLASKAEHYLQIRPGTDAALALCMANIIISEELYDHDFVSCWCYGFEELAAAAAEFTPEKTAEITWIPAEKIIAAARAFAQSKNAIMQWGVAVDMTKEAIPNGQAISALFEITGNIEKPGSMIVPPDILYYAGGWGQDLLSEEQAAKRIGLEQYPLLNLGFQECSTDEVVKAMETGKPYPLKAAWLQTTNFLACTAPDPERTLAAFKTLEFIVVIDLFMTPTAMALADVLLPAATFPERDGLRVGDGVQRGEAINKVVQVGECKSDMQINLELGKRLNPEAWPWADVQEMYSDILKETGMNFTELQENAPAYIPFEYNKHEKGLLREDGNVGFATPTGRIELWSHFYNKAELSPLPYFEEPSPGPGATPEMLDEYPLVLTTGARNWSLFHSEHRQIPRMRALRPDPMIQVNPETAAKYGVANGDWVWVENHRGRCKRRVETTPIVSPNVCSTDHGWWLPEAPAEEKDGLFGLWDVAIGKLIAYIPGRSGFGCNYKTMLCKIYKVGEGE
jgi:anaerobic selenocysteine-containing dehydrogenase